MEAGKLRHRVTIQRQTSVQDPSTGAMATSWADVWTRVPAGVEPLSAREFIQSQAGQSEVTARITIRYREGLDATMRITHRGKVYNIEGVLPDNMSGLEYITLPVSEGVNDGE